jgi:drug/metabolite transporter (DMT)-like permease
VVAPVTAVCAVAVPVAIAVLLGERLARPEGIGIALAMLAIVLVSQQGSSGMERGSAPKRLSGIGLALAAGVAIGFFFLALAKTTADAGLWPLVAARLVSVAFFGVVAVIARRSLRLDRNVALIVTIGGVLDMLANLLYLLAVRQGPLTLAVTLSSLYPTSTVMLARVFLHERLAARQWVGVVLALVAIVMIVG